MNYLYQRLWHLVISCNTICRLVVYLYFFLRNSYFDKVLPQHCEPLEDILQSKTSHTARMQLSWVLKKFGVRTQLHLQIRGNLTHSQSALNIFQMIIETHHPSVWLSPSVNIEWLVWGLVWAQWAIWHFEEALSHKPHRAVFCVITDTFLPLLAIHSHCVDVR